MNTISAKTTILIALFLFTYNNMYGQARYTDNICEPATASEWTCALDDSGCSNTDQLCVEATGSLVDIGYVIEINGVIEGVNLSGCIDDIILTSDNIICVSAFTYDLQDMDRFLREACFICSFIDCDYIFGNPGITDLIILFCNGDNDGIPGIHSLEELLDFAKATNSSIDMAGVHSAITGLNAVGLIDPICYAITEPVCIPNLPVELQSFKGFYNDCSINLKWETGSESNFSHFEVERSYDGIDFSVINRLSSTGNNDDTTGSTYTYTDENPASTNYYRLKMVDIDNTFSYSDVIVVTSECADRGTIIDVYPNPIKGNKLFVRLDSATDIDNVNVHVINQLGSVISEETISITKGSNIIEVNTDKLEAHTIYFLKIKNDQWNTKVVKVIKS